MSRHRRRIRDEVGNSLYYDTEGGFEISGEGLFDTMKNVATKVATKLTGKAAKKIATKAAEKLVEKGAEKVGEKTGQLIGEKIYDRFTTRESGESTTRESGESTTPVLRTESNENKGDLIIKELQKVKKPAPTLASPLKKPKNRLTVSQQFDELLDL